MLFVIALLLWIAPALVLGVALLWVCFRPGRRPDAPSEAGEAVPDAPPPTSAMPG